MDDKRFDFEKLDVYQRAVQFAGFIYDMTETFSKEHQYGLSDQLRRAALSISLNIAEGSGSQYYKEKRQFYRIARRSCFECIPALTLAMRQRLLPEKIYRKAYQECYELSKMLAGLIKSLKKDTV